MSYYITSHTTYHIHCEEVNRRCRLAAVTAGVAGALTTLSQLISESDKTLYEDSYDESFSATSAADCCVWQSVDVTHERSNLGVNFSASRPFTGNCWQPVAEGLQLDSEDMSLWNSDFFTTTGLLLFVPLLALLSFLTSTAHNTH